MATRYGVIKKTALNEFENIRKGGLIALNLREGDELMGVALSGGDDEFMLGTSSGMCIRFHEADVRAMGRTATGVRSISLGEADFVVDMVKVIPGASVLTVTENGLGKRTPEEAYRGQKRGGKGIIAMNITEKTGLLTCLKMTTQDEDLMLIRNDGMIIRLPIEQISLTVNRNTQGVRLMRADEGTRVVSVAVVPHSEEEQEMDEVPVE